MAEPTTSSGEMQRTLTLTGITVNAMALIAPGAFLWTTFQIQASQKGGKTAADMWTGLFCALVLALLTAYSYSELARIYPDAGTGSSYYFAEAALLDKESPEHQARARVAKLSIGWISHLYYWLYPAIMVGFMGILFGYIYTTAFHHTLTYIPQAGAAVILALICGYIAYRGVSGSTMASIVINVIQITTLTLVSILFIAYRIGHGHEVWALKNAGAVVIPHSFIHVIYQSTIAILLLVGFESVTALGAEALKPETDIKKGILLSLIIQGGVCYLFEYFAANFCGEYHDRHIRLGFGDPARLRGVGRRCRPHRHHGSPQHRRDLAVPHRHDGLADRRHDRAHRPARHHARMPQHRRAGHLRHGQGQGDARHPRHASRQVRHASRRHHRADRGIGCHRRLLRNAVQRRQHHPGHRGVQHRHVPGVRPHPVWWRSWPSPNAATSACSSTSWCPPSAASMNLGELFGVVYYLAITAGGATSKDAYKSIGIVVG